MKSLLQKICIECLIPIRKSRSIQIGKKKIKKCFAIRMMFFLLLPSALAVSAPSIGIVGAGAHGAIGQVDFAKPNPDMTQPNSTLKDSSGAGCVNIAGNWSVSESLTYACTVLDGYTFTNSGIGLDVVNLLQNGCNVNYAPSIINTPRSGQITGRQMSLNGAFLVSLDANIIISQNRVTLTGTVNESDRFVLNGTGTASGTAYGVPFLCTGNSIANFTRNGTPADKIECLLNWAEKAYSNLFSPAGAMSQFQSPYTYRYYSNTNSYVGVSYINNHVYYLGPNGVLEDVGDISAWLTTASCQ